MNETYKFLKENTQVNSALQLMMKSQVVDHLEIQLWWTIRYMLLLINTKMYLNKLRKTIMFV